MTKIMLVEDDKSLREIYGVRLLAEGYDIVSAGDGEEALAVAIKERPALIISDVMMPKISGFDMLDILRSTTETRGVKVIMMTALSSEEQRSRGEQLGADRYLVKSQVGIEDVVRVVHEVLGDAPGMPAPAAPPVVAPNNPVTPTYVSPQLATEPAAASHPTTLPQQRPTAPIAKPAASAPSMPTVPARPVPTPLATPRSTPPQPNPTMQTAATPTATPSPTSSTGVPTAPPPQSTVPPSPSATNKGRVIQPITNPASQSVNINELLDKELAREAQVDANNLPPVATTDQERQIINDQVNQFASQPGPSQQTPQNASTFGSAPEATPPETPPAGPPATPPTAPH